MSCPHGNPIGGCDTCNEVDAAFEAGKRSALAEQPAQQQEPVATWLGTDYEAHRQCFAQLCDLEPGTDLYTSPPAQRKPLTDEQIVAIIEHADGSEYSDIEFARAIEAAHGIKESA